MQNITLNRRQMLLGTGALSPDGADRNCGCCALLAQAVQAGPLLRRTRPGACQWWHGREVWHVHPLWRLQHHRPARVGSWKTEAIPVVEYAPHAAAFNPVKKLRPAWAKLAKAAGMKYMVMTTKHHEGFCKLTAKLTGTARKAGARTRSGARICRGCTSRRTPHWLLLLADGLALPTAQMRE